MDCLWNNVMSQETDSRKFYMYCGTDLPQVAKALSKITFTLWCAQSLILRYKKWLS